MVFFNNNTRGFAQILMRKRPDAVARLIGSMDHPAIKGTVSFYQTMQGVLLVAQVTNLPCIAGTCTAQVYGFHIHAGTSCTGHRSDAFADTKGHYNPNNCQHPQHAGDLPPLLGNDGYAWMAVLTDRFGVQEVMGRTVVIHRNPDDFTSQPSGRAGPKIACGVIQSRA